MAPELTKAQKRKSTTESAPKTKRPRKSEVPESESLPSKATKEDKVEPVKKAPKEKKAKKDEKVEPKETKAQKEKKAPKEKKALKDTEIVAEKPSTKVEKASTKDKATKEEKKAKKEKKEKPGAKIPVKRVMTPDSASDVEIITEKVPKAKKTKVAAAEDSKKSKKVIVADPTSDVEIVTEKALKAKKTEIASPKDTKKSKKGKKDKVVKKVIEEESDFDSDLEDDQTAALLAGFESSEDEADAEKAEGEGEDEGLEIDHLPDVPASDDLKRQLKEAGESSGEPGVIYVGRIPHGFYEHQMKAYFTQFGHIKRLRLSRNKRTGRSKHYAFIEFASADVADIVARTMNNYLLFQRLLQVRVVPSAQVHEELFKGAGKRFKKPAPRNAMWRKELEHGAERKDWESKVKAEQQRRIGKAKKLKSVFGYEFEAPQVRTVESVPVRAKAVEAA